MDSTGRVITIAGEGKFCHPLGVAVDAFGNIFVCDAVGSKIKKVSQQGIVSTFAGKDAGYADGVGDQAKFAFPSGIVLDGKGNLFVAEWNNHRIRKVSQQGVVSTVAGSTPGFEDGIGTAAKFHNPCGIALDSNNNLFIVEYHNCGIRKITPQGVVSTFAGNGLYGYADGDRVSAQFYYPTGITVDHQDNLYVADTANQKIRKITPSGMVSTIAGSSRGYKDGVGVQAQFNNPSAMVVDGAGNLLVCDSFNHKIRMVTSQGEVSTIAGGSSGNVDGKCSETLFDHPHGITLDLEGNIIVSDFHNNNLRKIIVYA